ncbi:hypothetical protein SKAU_G00283060 [Synaphobranchus kaupii]|uniref:Uncharacterized protein n=1 Tax=Synaphobranchus kaupii TaxID=118154 RepID=A0A9Q1EXJ3_SYNKA|nr:hypothetical protein SKAU_G00283060 [Synaphobranchus kaupii]
MTIATDSTPAFSLLRIPASYRRGVETPVRGDRCFRSREKEADVEEVRISRRVAKLARVPTGSHRDV